MSHYSAYLSYQLYRLLRGYVWPAADPSSTAHFNDLGRWDNIAHDAINAVMSWIDDSLVVCMRNDSSEVRVS
jgi:hypothetical protein